MTTHGSHEEPPPDAPGAGSTGDEKPVSEADFSERHVGRASAGGLGPSQLFDETEDPPPPGAAGKYRVDTGPMRHPSDPILPFIAPPVGRPRPRDWPVLVAVLVIAGLVMAGCCIAGFALYSARGLPFTQ
jgi:hypothetical protein